MTADNIRGRSSTYDHKGLSGKLSPPRHCPGYDTVLVLIKVIDRQIR